MTFLSDRWQSRTRPIYEAPIAPQSPQPASPRIFQRLFEASMKELEPYPGIEREYPPVRFAA